MLLLGTQAKMKANIYNKNKSVMVKVTFKIPAELGQALRSKELTNDQKINLVKSYTEDIKDEAGQEMIRIPNQDAVTLIMALELGAL